MKSNYVFNKESESEDSSESWSLSSHEEVTSAQGKFKGSLALSEFDEEDDDDVASWQQQGKEGSQECVSAKTRVGQTRGIDDDSSKTKEDNPTDI
ncbi:hypothetical protein SLA2020_400080 [Shorea laevis]